MKIDKMVTIYSKFRFDYHKGKQPGMVNAKTVKNRYQTLTRVRNWYKTLKTCEKIVSNPDM